MNARARIAVAVLAALCIWAGPFAGAAAGVFEQGAVQVVYDEGDEAFARRALEAATEALADFADRLPAGDEPIRIAVCGRLGEFHRFAGPYGEPGVLGVALPADGIIALKSPKLIPAATDFRGTLRHEMLHILIERNTDSGHMPRWLNEGMAMYLSGEYRWASSFRVAGMYLQGRLIPYGQLDLRLLEPGREREFGDAYAQSLSLTRFLYGRLGEEAFWAVFEEMRTKPFALALRHHSGLAEQDLEAAWKGSLWQVALVSSIVSGFGIFQLMAILTFVAYVHKRRLNRRKMREWEIEEAVEDGPPYVTWREVEDQEGLYAWEEEDDDYP